MSVLTAALLRGSVTESAGVANGTATATVAAIEGQTHLILGVDAYFNVGVSSRKTIVIKQGSTTVKTFDWDFTNDLFAFSFPVALSFGPNVAVSAELEASGAGGTSGFVSLWTALN